MRICVWEFCVCVCMRACMLASMCVNMYKCAHVWVCVHACVHVCVCVCVCVWWKLCLLFGKCLVWFLASRVTTQGCPWLFRETTDTSTHHVSTYFSLSSCSSSFTKELIYYYGKTVSQVPLTIFVNFVTVFTFVALDNKMRYWRWHILWCCQYV